MGNPRHNESERRVYSFEKVSSLYEESRRVPDAVLADLGRVLARQCEGPWLDLGAGTGRSTVPLLEAGQRVVALDIAESMLARLCEKGKGTGLWPVRGDFSALPFGPGTFAGAVGYHVLHLVHEPEDLLNGVFSVLRPDGPLMWLSDVPERAGNYLELKNRYSQLIDGRHPFGKPSSRDFEFVAGAVTRVGLSYEELDTPKLHWERTLRLSDLLSTFEGKGYSVLFPVPDDLHAELMGELRAWAVQALPSEEVISFRIRVVRIHR